MPCGIVVTMLDNVRGRLYRIQAGAAGIRREPIPFPDNGALHVMSASDETGEVFAEYESFLTPPTLYYLSSGSTDPRQVMAQQPTFDGNRFDVRQLWATSADGTRIPYFLVGPKDMKPDGSHPVWMFSYGGFENSLTPSYSGSYEDLRGVYGKLWLERGGVFVLPNIRGGGEFGPSWHTQALKANHVKTFEDFEAVARDLVARKITSARRLAIEGRSNGGLLVAATMIRHPELYGAVVCGSPLVDMKRYSHLLAGASWMAEYGDPDDPDDWTFLGAMSAYHVAAPGKCGELLTEGSRGLFGSKDHGAPRGTVSVTVVPFAFLETSSTVPPCNASTFAMGSVLHTRRVSRRQGAWMAPISNPCSVASVRMIRGSWLAGSFVTITSAPA
jgi:prolyl oligopeptidase